MSIQNSHKNRQIVRLFKKYECSCKQPFQKMIKDATFHGYKCPNCGNKRGVIFRDRWLRGVRI